MGFCSTLLLTITFSLSAWPNANVCVKDMDFSAPRIAVTVTLDEDFPYSIVAANQSEFAKLGITETRDLEGRTLWNLPNISTINTLYGLVEGKSKLIFKEYVPGDAVPKSIFDDHLAQGVILVSRYQGRWDDTFIHDIIDHVVGFKKMSETPTWLEMRNTLQQMTSAIENPKLRKRFKERIISERDSYCDDLDDISANITRGDADNWPKKVASNLLWYGEETQKLTSWWSRYKTSNNIK